MIINKNTELFNQPVEIDTDEENDEVYKWLSLLLLFIWILSMFVL
ncbi:MAG TPA: hypothetical protein PK605_00940 [Ignavibacteria bacterium]|nr:hypothetical protein [Ignavibacteria bacterium]HRF65558.1 hypothetical protein [Ignavibacteria bacterium]HRJ02946.1 hypothetical protein [Ignavibacteria bacterium]HRJ84183.1 hypothetical protein [Ignavibacteria bacterium]